MKIKRSAVTDTLTFNRAQNTFFIQFSLRTSIWRWWILNWIRFNIILCTRKKIRKQKIKKLKFFFNETSVVHEQFQLYMPIHNSLSKTFAFLRHSQFSHMLFCTHFRAIFCWDTQFKHIHISRWILECMQILKLVLLFFGCAMHMQIYVWWSLYVEKCQWPASNVQSC